MSSVTLDVLCVGHASYDIIMLVDHHPGADEKCRAEGMEACGGGPAANAAVAVARLGGTSAFAGYLGEDEYGNRHLKELVSEGVWTHPVIRGETETPLSLILVKPDGRRTVVNYRAPTTFHRLAGIDLTGYRPKAVLFDGHELETSIQLAREAKRLGIPTILDAGSVHAGTETLAHMVDYLAASNRFAADFTTESDPQRALNKLRSVASVVLITLGQEGVIWSQGDTTSAAPAFPVKPVDTTGAGDAFHGALALGIARGEPLVRSIRVACAAAAICCTRLGARPGLPRTRDLREFLRNRGVEGLF